MAIELHSGKCVTLSQLGSDFKVSQLKKDNMWKSVRLLDILEAKRQYGMRSTFANIIYIYHI